jgi:2,4-dienoyl-CoA reductase-like NADH-dependent reductase (Old Yellow Enzyme family)
VADLFSEYRLQSVRLRNRIAMSPMCQYSAMDGAVGAWHLVNLGARAVGGAGLVIAEASAVSPEGRISPGDAGLWSDAHAEAYAPIAHFIAAQGAVPGIQLAHAGRKGCANAPWAGEDQLPADDPRAWQTIAPSALAFGKKLPRVPRAMTEADIARVSAEFAAAARRALEAGFQWLVLHYAHGYLAQSFWSPLANRRTDRYGGSFENRARFLLETLAAVRAVWPEHLPLTARLGVLDYVAGEQPLEESIELARRMKAGGLDLLDVSAGFNTPDVSHVPWKEPAFLAPIAARVGREAGIPVAASWNIGEPRLADQLVRDGLLDLVMVGRALLADPYWPYRAAQALGLAAPYTVLPPQYQYVLKR